MPEVRQDNPLYISLF